MIPKIIHYCWISGEAYPPPVKDCLASWKKHIPDYELRKWDASNFDMAAVEWTKESYQSGVYAFVADYIRFYALYHYGGIYLDCDVEVVKAFDDLLCYGTFFGYEYTGLPEAAVIGCAPKQAWVRECLLWYEQHSFLDRHGRQQRVIAPLVMKSCFEKTNGIQLLDNGTISRQGNSALFPYDYFSPKDCFSNRILKTDNTYTVHLFKSAWLKKNWKTKVKKYINLLLIKMLGKVKYNRMMYHLRKRDK